jgi:hypothetical protein
MARSDNRSLLIGLLQQGYNKIGADLNRIGSAFVGADVDDDGLPQAAHDALGAAITDAQALRDNVRVQVPSGTPGRDHALAGLASFLKGLRAVLEVWVALEEPGPDTVSNVKREREAEEAFPRAQAELLAADRALGCVFGCQPRKPPPVAPPFGTAS